MGDGIEQSGYGRRVLGERRRCIIVRVDGKVEGVCDTTLQRVVSTERTGRGQAKVRTLVRKNKLRSAGSMGMRPEIANGRICALTSLATDVANTAWASLA